MIQPVLQALFLHSALWILSTRCLLIGKRLEDCLLRGNEGPQRKEQQILLRSFQQNGHIFSCTKQHILLPSIWEGCYCFDEITLPLLVCIKVNLLLVNSFLPKISTGCYWSFPTIWVINSISHHLPGPPGGYSGMSKPRCKFQAWGSCMTTVHGHVPCFW